MSFKGWGSLYCLRASVRAYRGFRKGSSEGLGLWVLALQVYGSVCSEVLGAQGFVLDDVSLLGLAFEVKPRSPNSITNLAFGRPLTS